MPGRFDPGKALGERQSIKTERYDHDRPDRASRQGEGPRRSGNCGRAMYRSRREAGSRGRFARRGRARGYRRQKGRGRGGIAACWRWPDSVPFVA